MTDESRHAWWPELYEVMAELRVLGRHDIADDLDRSVHGSATSSELLGNVGLVLRTHEVQRSRLGMEGRGAWDRIMRDVNRHSPLRALAYRLRRFLWP